MKASERGYSTRHIARTIRGLQEDVNEQIEFVEETGDKQLYFDFLIVCLGRYERSIVSQSR